MADGERKRAIAKCCSCSSAYAVNVWTDGTIQPIGRSSCGCGSTEFQIIESSSDTSIQDEKID
ncbi:hypothetical protein GCU68_18080 (plasmid) [Natronorubrum aibiense]|uniref:Uncharacterized protein n=1 Tax=Natronorubrum aibiense TaxID=348826 RepID=A0A5P9P8J3_9EURY|nr:hypothetical protein GCU68_18080 [Natronorubrum aibiense]